MDMSSGGVASFGLFAENIHWKIFYFPTLKQRTIYYNLSPGLLLTSRSLVMTNKEPTPGRPTGPSPFKLPAAPLWPHNLGIRTGLLGSPARPFSL